MLKSIKIGGASGFWGESMMATPQFLASGACDYIVYDFLAEITMSILARARAASPERGFATDFVNGAMAPNLHEIARQGVKILSNAGGVNPDACADAVRALIAEQGLSLKVGVVRGDDLYARRAAFAGASEMFSDDSFPPADKIASMNAYLGAYPIVAALRAGADIVITGRSVDSAVTLAACIDAFGWGVEDWDLLAAGSLAGHIIECGPQATGGNFTDWRDAGDISEIGYPFVEVEASGVFICSKPAGTEGIVNVGTISEQMLYEIGDPQAYLLPDVVCDFSDVVIEQAGDNRVRVAGVRGRAAPSHYKASITYFDGFRGGTLLSFIGLDASAKAAHFAQSAFKRARMVLREHNMGDFLETSVEVLGADSQYGADPLDVAGNREVVLKIAAKSEAQASIGILLKEITGLALSTPPGLSIFAGGRAKPSPVVRLFSCLVPKSAIEISVDIDGEAVAFEAHIAGAADAIIERPTPPALPDDADSAVPLIKLAWGRSGDKGNKANIGIIAREADYLPYIWAALDEKAVARHFDHFLEDSDKVARFLLPGSHAINYLLDAALGGGGIASLRNDAQAKAYAQLLLDYPIPVSSALAARLK